MMDFEQAKKVLQLTDARIRKFGSVDAYGNQSQSRRVSRICPSQHGQTNLRAQTEGGGGAAISASSAA
jgi:hypothetical protein